MNALIDYRKRNDITQEALAELLGVTQGLVAHIENGRRKPSAALARIVEQVTDGAVSKSVLRPDIYPPDEFKQSA